MTKKSKTILLLAVAGCVWGYTGLKWLNYFSVEGDGNLLMQQSVSMIPDIVFEEKKEYILNANYKDPFLKNVKYKSVAKTHLSHTQKTVRPTPVKPVIVKPNYKWPVVEYSGFILSGKEKLGLLKILNQDILAKKGDIHNQITVLGIYADSIMLASGDNNKTVLKK